MAEKLIDRTEVEMARQMFAEAIFAIEAEHRSVGAFATAALLAAAELYSEVHGGDELRRAFVGIAKAEEIASGAAGRA